MNSLLFLIALFAVFASAEEDALRAGASNYEADADACTCAGRDDNTCEDCKVCTWDDESGDRAECTLARRNLEDSPEEEDSDDEADANFCGGAENAPACDKLNDNDAKPEDVSCNWEETACVSVSEGR